MCCMPVNTLMKLKNLQYKILVSETFLIPLPLKTRHVYKGYPGVAIVQVELPDCGSNSGRRLATEN